MAKQKTKEDRLLDEYENKQKAILLKMYQIIMSAQRKAEDKNYAKILQQLENE